MDETEKCLYDRWIAIKLKGWLSFSLVVPNPLLPKGIIMILIKKKRKEKEKECSYNHPIEK